MSKEVCPPLPKTPGAITTAASHRVCRAVKERDAAKAKLDRAPAIMQSMVEELQKLRDSVPSLRADLEAAETELAIASVENDKVLQQAHVPVVQIQVPEGMGDDAKAFVYDIKAQIEPLSKQLAILCSPGTGSSSFQQQQRQGDKHDKQQQHEGKHGKQQQQQQHDEHRHKQGGEASAGEVAGNRWGASVPPNVDPWVSGGDLSDPGHEMPVDEIAKRKKVSFDPYADGAGDMPMPASTPEVEVVSSDDDDDACNPPPFFRISQGLMTLILCLERFMGALRLSMIAGTPRRSLPWRTPLLGQSFCCLERSKWLRCFVFLLMLGVLVPPTLARGCRWVWWVAWGWALAPLIV